MNKKVEEIQNWYRNEKELSNYSIMDIGGKLKNLAEKGLIWVLKDLKDTTESERIVINYYLDKYRAVQIYDNLHDLTPILSSNDEYASTPSKSSKHIIPLQNKQHTLEVRDVQQFNGYQKAKELEERIIELCKNFPSFEFYHIVNQIERSAESIKKRIQIGEQIYIREKFNQYSIAVGSAKETSAWLQVSLGQKYITQNQFEELDNMVNHVIGILTKNLSNIKEKEGKGLDLPSPYTPNVKNFGAYDNALLLVEMIYEVTRRREFWKEKDLVRKMRKQATSCVANIAEAHQLYIKKKFRFFNDSLKALRGLESSLETSVSKGITSKESLKEISELRISIRNVLSANMSNISSERAS
ncbi:four helix bundle protein [Gracilibacillus salinarum]|uniref:Four helix bundle protein n=1 Tax=Gracilibacillus salinarum TaxID=2932255 RepID=A0ABY4GK51_9BACI|nr:four helix bundle protein [Gracilibacillus salinarum]UOQ84642.1 four helix bundle protein [Gracilibacillus salinarum]